MKIVFGMALTTLLFVPLQLLQAGNCSYCYVESIATGPAIDRDCASKACVLIRVKVAGGEFTPDDCAKANGWQYVLDTSTPTGKITLRQLLAAHINETRVVIGGDGKCKTHKSGTVEDVGYVHFYWKSETVIKDPTQLYSYW